MEWKIATYVTADQFYIRVPVQADYMDDPANFSSFCSTCRVIVVMMMMVVVLMVVAVLLVAFLIAARNPRLQNA